MKSTHYPRKENYKMAKIKKSSLIEPLGRFQPNLGKSILGERGFTFVQMEMPHLLTLGDYSKIAKVYSRN